MIPLPTHAHTQTNAIMINNDDTPSQHTQTRTHKPLRLLCVCLLHYIGNI